RRNGIGLKTTTTAVSTEKLWNYFGPSNNEWLIRLSTDGVLTAGISIGTSESGFSVRIGTVSTSVDSDAAVCLGNLWITNRQDGLQYWNETNFVKVQNAPFAARIECFKNRIVLGDISNRQSSVDFSGDQNGTDW